MDLIRQNSIAFVWKPICLFPVFGEFFIEFNNFAFLDRIPVDSLTNISSFFFLSCEKLFVDENTKQ